MIQHPADRSLDEIKTLYEQLLVPIVPKEFIRSDIRTSQEATITNVFPSFKCAAHPIFAPEEAQWALTFFTAYHPLLIPPADVVLFLDYDTYGIYTPDWLKRKLVRDWSVKTLLSTVGSLFIGSALEKGGDLITPKNYELANVWAREKAGLCVLFLNFGAEPSSVLREIFKSFETHFDNERRAAIKLVD